MRTMALFTTTPASDITPTPVMMMPKGWRCRARPRKAPPRESTTVTMIRKGWLMELNWATSTRKMSSTATAKAWPRKVSDSCWNSNSPVKRTR